MLLGEGRLDGERVGVEEGCLVEQREAASLLELLGRRVRGVRVVRALGLVGELGQDHPGVLGVHVEAAAGQRLVDDLRGADVRLERDLVALGAQRLRVELAEDVLLGEVLVAERDGRLALAGLAAGGAGGGGLVVVRRAARRECEREGHREKSGEATGPGPAGHGSS